MLLLACSSHSGRGENDFTMRRGCGCSCYACKPAKLSLSCLNLTSEVMLGHKYRISYFRVYFSGIHVSGQVTWVFSNLCNLCWSKNLMAYLNMCYITVREKCKPAIPLKGKTISVSICVCIYMFCFGENNVREGEMRATDSVCHIKQGSWAV